MKRQMMLRAAASLLVLLTLTGCVSPAAAQTVYNRYSRSDLSVFDTVIQIIGFAPDQESFDRIATEAIERLRALDHAFDGYNEYEGLHNLYYVNAHAAEEPVSVPEELFALLSWCKAQWEQGRRETNVAMGAVLSIWHEYREEGLAHPEAAKLPPSDALTAANAHTDFDQVILDAEKQTVFFADPALRLDIGAVAKGYAADQIASYLFAEMPSFLLSLGGNVYAGHAPLDGRTAWAVGVQDPRPGENSASGIMDILDVTDRTVVTSGDYWRYYTVDGIRYHHIIDPATLSPSRRMLSVTVVCQDSTLADFLSTTLFVLDYEPGRQLVDSLEGVDALWVLPDGAVRATDGMASYARSLKNP